MVGDIVVFNMDGYDIQVNIGDPKQVAMVGYTPHLENVGGVLVPPNVAKRLRSFGGDMTPTTVYTGNPPQCEVNSPSIGPTQDNDIEGWPDCYGPHDRDIKEHWYLE